MAKAFNLTAQLNLQGPTNLKPVINKIRNELSNIKVDLQFKVPQAASKEIGNVTKKINDLSFAAIKAEGNIAGLAKSLSALNSSFSSVASTSSKSASSINQIQSSVSGTTKNINESTSAIEGFGKQAGLAIKRFAAFSTVTGAVLGLTNAISAAYTEFLQFNKEIVRLSQVTGSSISDLKGVSDEITRLSTTLGVASSDLIQVTSTLAQAGLSASDTKTALEALAKSSLAPSFEDINKTTEGSIAILRQFGLGAKDLEKALGSVNSVAAAFAVESSDIITAIQRTGGVFAASSKGVSEGTDALNEFIAVFTSIRATSRESAETIATGLRTIFTRIQRPKTIEELKKLGIELRDAQGQFVGTYEAVRRLSEGLSQIDPRSAQFANIAEELGGFRQIGKVIPLIQQFATAQEALGVAQRGQGSLTKDAITAQQALSVQFAKTRENFLALVRDIGESSSFQGFVTIVLGLTNAFIGLAGALKPLLPLLLTLTTLKAGSLLTQYSSGLLKGLTGVKKAGGGPIGFARGGLVPGRGNGDTVPAMLSPGEFVIRKKAVETIGASNLEAMNKYAAGGPVSPNKLYSVKMKGYIKNNLDNNDEIYFNKIIYGLQSTKNVKSDTFEKLVQSKLMGQLIGGNFPVDIIKTGDGPVEVRNRQEATPDYVLADKLMRFYLEDNQTNYINKFTNKKNGKSDPINLGNIGIAYNLAKYKPSNYKQLNSGGLIQKFLEGGGVKDIASAQGKDIEEVILGFVKALGGIGGVKDYLNLPDNDRSLNRVLRKGAIANNLDAAVDAIDRARKAAEDRGTLRAAAMAQAQQLAIVGMDPLDYSNTLFEKISNTDSTIHIKGLLGQYADEAAYIQQGMSNFVASSARRLQSKAIFGGNKNLAFDFDDTLVSGADIYKPGTNEIDISGYSDLNKVQKVLNGPNVRLTELGQALKSILQSNPDILNQIRILTARPQSNAPLLAAKLQDLGLNIPASKITGVSGSRNKPANLGQNEKLIDDLYATVAAVRKGGGEAFPYSPIQDLSKQEQYAANLAAAEGSALQAILVALGARGGSIQNEDVDFKSGLGPQAASFFGIDPNIPTEVKRTLSSDAIYKAKLEFAKFFASRGMASGGSVEDTVPAMLTPGEFVINKKAAQKIGSAQLHRLNKADKVRGYNKGGPVNGIQYFQDGGSARLGKSDPNKLENWINSLKEAADTLKDAADKSKDVADTEAKTQRESQSGGGGGNMIIAAQIGAEVLRGQIDSIVKSFDSLQVSGVQGLLKGFQQASSAALSTSIGLKAVGASAQQQARGAAAAGGLGLVAGVFSGAGQTVLDDSLKRTAAKFSDFDKSLQDIKDATDETAKALAQEEVSRSFTRLRETLDSTISTINISETFVGLGKVIQDTTEAGIAGYQAQLALTTSLQTLDAAAKASALATAASGAAGIGGTLLPILGKVASFGLKFVPILGAVITGFSLVTSAFSFFSNITKKSSEELIKFAKATQQAALNSPSNQLTDVNFRNNILPIVSEARSRGVNLSTQVGAVRLSETTEIDKSLAQAVYQKLDLNPLNRALINNIEDILKTTLSDIERIGPRGERLDLNALFDNPQTRDRVSAAVGQALPQFINSQFKLLESQGKIEPLRKEIGLPGLFGFSETQQRAALSKTPNAEAASDLLNKLNLSNLDKTSQSVGRLINVLDSLNKSFDNLTARSSLAFKRLDDSVSAALGQSKIESITRPFEENINTLSNLSKASGEEIKRALSSSRQLLVGGRLSSAGARTGPGLFQGQPVAGINNPDIASTFFTRLEQNINQLAKIETELPSVLQTIAEEPSIQQDEIIRRLETIFSRDNKNTDTVEALRSLSEAIIGIKASGGTQPLGQADLAKLDQATAKALEGLRASPEALIKANEAVIKAQQDYAQAIDKYTNLQLQAANTAAQIAEVQNNIDITRVKIGGGQPSLSLLNAPFNAALKELSGGLTSPSEIAAEIRSRTEARNSLSALATDQELLATDTTKLNKALDLLATSTIKASNAMQKAAEVEAELTSRRNLFESLIVGQAEDPTTLLKFEGVLRSIENARANIASESDIVNILKNIGQFSELQQKQIRASLLPNYERLGGPFGRMARAFGAPEEDPTLRGYQNEAQKAALDQLGALKERLKLEEDALKVYKDRLPTIRETFLNGLNTELQNILTGMAKIRSGLTETTTSATGQQSLKFPFISSPVSGMDFKNYLNSLSNQQFTFGPSGRRRVSTFDATQSVLPLVKELSSAFDGAGLSDLANQRQILYSILTDVKTQQKQAISNNNLSLGLFLLDKVIPELERKLDVLNKALPDVRPQPIQQQQIPQNVPQPAATDSSQFLKDLKKVFDDGSQQIATAMAAFDAKNLKESVGEFKQSVGTFGTQVAKIPTEVQRKDEVSISFDQPLQVDNMNNANNAIGSQIMDKINTLAVDLMTSQRNARLTV